MKLQYIKIDEDGNKFYYADKGMTKLHREDGPAVECTDGTKEWWLNGKCHREDGPACEWSDGSKSWWLNDERHREDGPAIEYADGFKRWYVDGKYLTEEQFNNRRNASCNGKIVEIDGPASECTDGTMKPLFDNQLSITTEGMKIGQEFENFLKVFTKKHKLHEYNPIELNHIMTSELALTMEGLYLDVTQSFYLNHENI